jgi:hypothetical protein
VRRDAFGRVGGFRPFLAGARAERSGPWLKGLMPRLGQTPFGEDIWFGWRARRAGARTAFCAEALVHHEVAPLGFRGMAAHRARVRSFPALVRELPELREAFFYRRWFLTRRSAAFDLAALAVGAAVRWRRPALALGAAPYVAVALRAEGGLRRGAPRRALSKLPGDAVVCLALVAGSVAARRVVL